MNHLRLIRHQIQLHVRGKGRLKLFQLGAHRVAEVNDVVAFVHFHREQNGLFAVAARILTRILVDARHIGHVAHVNRLPGGRNIHSYLANLILGRETAAGFEGYFVAAGRHTACILNRIATRERLHDPKRVDGILRQLLGRGADVDFFLLIADALDLRDRRNGAQPRFHGLRVVFQLPGAIVAAMDRNQRRHRVAEVGIDDRAHHPRRQSGGLQLRHIKAQFRPELIRILDRLVQLDIDEHHAVAAGGKGLFAAHFLEPEEPLLDLAGDLVFHLLRGRARIDGGHNAGADGDLRILAPRHRHQRIQACHEQHSGEDQCDLGIAQSRADWVHWLPPTTLTSAPSCTFCCPATTICSFPLSPL